MLGSMTPGTWDQGHSQATTADQQQPDLTLLVPGPILISEAGALDSRLITDCQSLEMPRGRGLGVEPEYQVTRGFWLLKQ